MRQLYVLRGLPGAGKSTFITENNLEAYTISPDAIRLVMGAPVLNTEGRLVMPTKDDSKVWKLLRETLEARMARGELLVIDATHTLPTYFNDYAKLAQKYRYKTYAVDFADVPLEVCKERNAGRTAYKIVDEKVLDTMHSRLTKHSIPKSFEVLKPEDMPRTLENDIVDLSGYSRVHHFGDIQGCYTPLRQYFDVYPYSPNDFYIFTGDLLDRGTENSQVLQYICNELVDKPNVVFVEGNHDQHLWNWLTKQPVHSREFNGRTREQLEADDIGKAAVSRIFKKMHESYVYSYGSKQVLVCHGGLSTMPERLKFISTDQFVRGAGYYSDVGAVDDAFVATTNENMYQIHGHRNQQNYPLMQNERCFNLEGKVEFGGELRVLQLTAEGFTPVEVENKSSELQLHPENAPLVYSLRANRHIAEHSLPGSISSFHFKSEVFFNKSWTKQTITARGLFINTLTNEIVIRSYDKFFNIGERRDTEMTALRAKLTFPVKAWVKENGYLGLIGYDAVSGELIFASKSTTEGDFAGWFKELFIRKYRTHLATIKDYLKANNVCLVFEVLLPKHDPHIISYKEDEVVLLEIVKRQAEYTALPDETREEFAASLSLKPKQHAKTFTTWDEFEAWHESLQNLEYTFDGAHIEGFVLEDASNYHVKVKLDYYSFWKQLRSALDAIKAGKLPKIKQECKYPELAQEVIDFMQNMPAEDTAKADIIAVREKFLASHNDA